jgi:hypothetical protein
MSTKKLVQDMAVGDGYITKPKSATALSRLVMKHSSLQVDYLLWKKAILEKNGIKCAFDAYTDKHGYGVVQVRTTNTAEIREIRDAMYHDGAKHLTPDFIASFDAFSLALLFQDDGSREHRKWDYRPAGKVAVNPYINQFVLHVCNFASNEVEMLAKRLSEMGIEARMKLRKMQPVLIVSKVEAKRRFVDLVSPFLCPSMGYKIDLPVSVW